MNKKTTILFLLALTFLCSAASVNAQQTTITDPRFPRKALVAPDCMINSIINVVGVGSSAPDLNNLLDENLDNYASFKGLAEVGVLADPIIRVKDRKNIYPAGTVAGFCIQTDAGSKLLSLDLLSGMSIILYKEGRLQETITVKEGQGSVLNLNLIQIGGTSNEVTSFLTVESTKEFDEIGLISSGVDVNVLSNIKLKYAFVGDADDTYLISKNLPGIKVSGINDVLNLNPSNNLIDDNLNNYAGVPAILIDPGVTISLEWDKAKMFPVGSKVGFKFEDANILGINIANTFKIKLTGSSGTSTIDINTTVLGLDLIGTSTKDVSVFAPIEFYKAELIISGLGISVKARKFYYGYIQNPTEVTHHHDLGLSADATICDSESSYQLASKEKVTWSIIPQPEGGGANVTPEGKVTNMTTEGDYTFQATASDGCTGTVTITKGITRSIDPGCDEAISATSLALSDNTHGITGSLISISNLKDETNIIDDNLYTYAEYTGGLSVAENLEITGIRRTDGDSWSSGTSGSRVGFVVEANQTFLNADVLSFLRVRLYNSKTSQWVVSDGRIDKTDVISTGLIGSEKTAKVRYSIDVPAGISFDEVTLWKSGVLSLQLSTIHIYGAFIEDNTLHCYSDPLGCSSTIISTESTGASINYNATGITGLANVSAMMLNIENLIDGDMDTYAYTTGIEVASKTSFAVKLGREYNSSHQVGIVIDNATYLAGVGLADWMTVETYYKDSSTGDTQTNWKVLGVNAIGYGDKTYLMMNPISPYDEIRVTCTGIADVLDGFKLYGIFVRSDADGDGVPDCMDEESCSSDNTGLNDVMLEFSRICQNNNLTITGKGYPGNSYTLKCPALGIDGQSVTIDGNSGGDAGTPETSSFEWTCGPMQKAGHYSLAIIDKNGRVVATPTFTVHPLATTWKQSPVDTDWNNWDNWSDGSPLACTNVTIPAGCSDYPVLTDAAANQCNNIHFESGAEVVKTHLLHYQKASVDLTIEPGRYYMLSAPLKDMVTGDMFIPTGGNPAVFTPADAKTAPQNRFNPRIYQRLWATNAEGQPMNGNKITVTPDETRWTPPFNALAQTYEMGKGFSMKAVAGTATAPLTFRFPKEHTEYEYVTGDNVPTGIKETITRVNAGRFIYENNTSTVSFPLTVTLTNMEEGTVFLAGNPFMSHIDVQKFLDGNTGITSVKVYDGNTTNSMISADGELLSSDGTPGYDRIAPMQSFFVTAGTSASEREIQYTEDMLVPAPENLLKSTRSLRADDVDKLILTARSSGYEAHALLRFTPDASDRYLAGEDAEVLIDSEVRPVIALFSVADGKALDIQQLAEATEIPLGFYLRQPASVDLSVRQAGNGSRGGWQLFDAETGQTFPLDGREPVIRLGRLSTNTGRFFLRNGAATSNDDLKATGRRIYCFREGASSVVVRSMSGEMERCEIYSVDGKLIDNASHAADEYRLRLSPGVNLIRAYLPGMPVQVMKLLCY